MKRFSIFAGLLALFAGTAAMLDSNPPMTLQTPASAMLNGAAAFRDGLYLGRITAQRGEAMHIASGRWATAVDRGLFTAGFEQGYRDSQASRIRSAGVNQRQ